MPQCPTLFCCICVAYKWGHGNFGQPCYNDPTDNVVVLNWNEKLPKQSRVKLKWVQVTWTLCTHTEYTLWKIMGNNSSSLPEYWLSPPLWSAPVPQSHLKVISQFRFKPVDTLFLTRAFESTINYWSTWPMTYRGGWAQLSLIDWCLTNHVSTN